MELRPWFLSLTAILNDDSDAVEQLNTALNKLENIITFPQHHILVPSKARHLTIFAILQINSLPNSDTTFRDYSRNLINLLTTDTSLVNKLSQNFGASLTLDADEVRIYDNGTVVQFQGTDTLSRFRSKAREILVNPVFDIINSLTKGTVVSLVTEDTIKNKGDRAFGSIARSPCHSDQPIERYRVSLKVPVKFNFQYIHLLTSDDALTNPRIPDVEDFIIGNYK